MSGVLILAATPIGRPDDATQRLRDLLATTPVIAAEDTRRLRRLVRDLGVDPTGRVVSFFDGNERERQGELLDALRGGENVVLVTDAGMPSVSDPGYRLVAACIAEGLRVTVAPGASAVPAALAVSGLPTDRFCFDGFVPRKAGERATFFDALRTEPRTIVLFEAPHRLPETLVAMREAFGADRRAAVCRELTKTYEEVVRGTLDDLVERFADEARGEITLVVEGAPPSSAGDVDLADLVASFEAAGMTRKDAITAVVERTGARKRDVFDAVVAAKPR
jgi:16S rRNA (cytidine1402-2'-O)-methyltransferase